LTAEMGIILWTTNVKVRLTIVPRNELKLSSGWLHNVECYILKMVTLLFFLDVDECQPSGHRCSDPNAICTNTAGSYHCNNCKPGYSFDGSKCAGTSECLNWEENSIAVNFVHALMIMVIKYLTQCVVAQLHY
jgi:hypothetical protein